ncbi:DUF4286 domain-containing protein [Sphingobacteriales bacterium UPWRP_1]|nr:hypothetical protein BVG80_02985 [Sphingobacteriales bacterium TSM_CSM]PSJ75452.1 DUF4286 domain-containing protein [Sphingobacteriales bacterium UPWRP_1]
MYLYNVTVKIDPEKHDDWLHWMQSVHIPDVMKTGLFEQYRLCKLLEQDESGGITYAVQYLFNNMADYFTYQQQFAPHFQQQHAERYRNHFVAFRTLLRIVAESG